MEENILYIGGNVACKSHFLFSKSVVRRHIEVLSKDTFCMKNKIYILDICMHVFAGCKYYFCLHLISASKI